MLERAQLFPLLLMLAVAVAGCGKREPVAGFDFERLDAAGKPLAEGPIRAAWPCVLDRRTGLVWEAKAAQPGLHYSGNTYSWYEPQPGRGAGDAGTANGGSCSGSSCDTHGFVEAVNRQGWCGRRDWRLPGKEELQTLVDPAVHFPGPAIDTAYFPDTRSGEYWTSTPYVFFGGGAWAWGFDFGLDRVDWKKTAKYVRAVQGEWKKP